MKGNDDVAQCKKELIAFHSVPALSRSMEWKLSMTLSASPVVVVTTTKERIVSDGGEVQAAHVMIWLVDKISAALVDTTVLLQGHHPWPAPAAPGDASTS